MVTGASGFLGGWVCDHLSQRKDCQVLALSRSPALTAWAGQQAVHADLSDQAACHRLFEDFRPNAVIHTAALSDPNACESNPPESQRVNVDATSHIALACRHANVFMIFTSTDLVFDGTTGKYQEDSPVNPVNVYGAHKVEAERIVRTMCPEAIVARLPWMFGIGLTRKSPFSSIAEKLLSGEPVTGFVDELRSTVSYSVAAAGLVQLLGGPRGQTLHLGGKDTVSRYAFFRMLAKQLGAGPLLVEGKRQAELVFPARRPPDVSLVSERAYANGFTVPPLAEMICTELTRDGFTR